MEPLLQQLRALPGKLGTSGRIAVGGALAALIAIAAVVGLQGGGERYQYAFTNLSAEDSSEAAATLKAANVPFRLEAGGAALAVPGDKVYDARLLLASAGIPRGGGVGFELFDRGDLGVSEFTQKVNLRRALEGELARTISRLAPVRSARVHLTIGEKGLYRDDDHKASAAIVLNLQPGRTLGEREIAGIRHLVASAVSGLSASSVSILDGQGAVLATEQENGEGLSSEGRPLEKDLESRIVALLEPVVGRGAVIAKVTASLDSSEVRSQAEVFDPEATAVRNEHKTSQSAQQEANGGVAGAAGNQPLQPPVGAGLTPQGRSTTSQDETRSFEVSHTTTNTVQRGPRLKRLSVAVLLDGKDDKPRPDAEVAHLGDLAKRAIGFDAARGDVFEMSSTVFTKAAADTNVTPAPLPAQILTKPLLFLGGGVAILAVLAALYFALRSRRSTPDEILRPQPILRPGAQVAEIEATLAGTAAAVPTLDDPSVAIAVRARELARADPARAAHLLRAWIQSDNSEKSGGANG